MTKFRLGRVGVCFLSLGWLFFGVGCSTYEKGAVVEGEVTLDGKPIPTGSISFDPVDGTTSTAGAEIKDGKYSVNVEPGLKNVKINASKVVGQKRAYEGDPNSPKVDITEEYIPPRYNTQTELTYDVKSGKNTKTFDLKSSGEP
jgi:hypothetical protein